jgi:O-antigen/teichoic acid export membrane protein
MTSENNKRIAKNTLMLYFRMLFSMGVSLYTSRVILNTLGVEDFGIYNVVGGIVTMFTLVSGSLSSASQRFITFELGKKEDRNVQEVFSTTVTVHILLAVIVFILAESAGIWFLNTHMNITPSRMHAANWVFQCSLLSFLVSLISIPYNAAIIAHERMKAFAYIGMGEVLLKLGAVVVLPFLPFDKLKIYAILIMFVAVIIRGIYSYYCKKNIVACVFTFSWNQTLFKSIAGFAGWNFIGISSAVLMTQGVSILLNIFYGVAVNAAQGIARQVQVAISGFITNFMTALNPQITKSYASNNHEYMGILVFQGARYSFYLMFFLSLPILIETETVLTFWLKIVPEYAVVFVRLSLIYAVIQTLSQTLITAQLATGKIKKYQLVIGGLQMLNFPFSYIALKMGFSPQSTLFIAIALSFACLCARLFLLHGIIVMSVSYYVRHVILNVITVVFFSATIPVVTFLFMDSGLSRLICICVECGLLTTAAIYQIGLSKKEQFYFHRKIASLRIFPRG